MATFWYLRLKGTVIVKIWWQILLVMLYTAAIVSMHKYVPELRMEFKQTLIPILGVVTGLLLVFRTNTAYDRYINICCPILFIKVRVYDTKNLKT